MSMYSKVLQFHDKYEIPFDENWLKLQLTFVEEEYEEWLEEAFRHGELKPHLELKELCDLLYVLLGYLLQLDAGIERHYDYPTVADELIPAIEDLLDEAYNNKARRTSYLTVLKAIVACVEYAKEQEWDIIEAFNRVHASNLTKAKQGPGKVKKGPNYVKPDLKDLV